MTLCLKTTKNVTHGFSLCQNLLNADSKMNFWRENSKFSHFMIYLLALRANPGGLAKCVARFARNVVKMRLFK